MSEFGYAGKILRVDLSRNATSELDTSRYGDRFLGGRGIAAKIYWDEVPPGTTAFNPENRLIFITGPLAGFYGLAGSRWQICGKSPYVSPESFSYANLGGSWGAYLKMAGYDGVVVHGKADKPVYLFIKDGTAEIKNASFLWGKSTVATQSALKEIHGKETRVAATGPAGENLSSIAIVLADDDAAGSGGFGAVMGSKNLKAVAVNGSGRLVAADPQALDELRRYVRELRRDAPTVYACGLHHTFLESNPRMKKVACWGCISGCARAVYQAADGSRRSKFMCQPPLLYMEPARKYYGEINDVPYFAVRLCDEWGLDVTAVQGLLIWLRRCVRAGILSDGQTGLPSAKFGSLEFIESMVRMVSLREGFGDVLAGGAVRAAAAVGDKAREQLKDDLYRTGTYYPYGPRLYILTGLLYATEPRIPIQQLHEVSFIVHEWVDWQKKLPGSFVSSDVLRAISRRFFGGELALDFSTYEGKAAAAVRIQEREYAKECLVLCDFSWPMRYVRGSADHIGDPTVESKILAAVTGRLVDEAGLRGIGERVFNLWRAILVREGVKGRENDTIPESDFTIPLKLEFGNPDGILPGKGGAVISRQGAVVDRTAFEKLKDEYYHLRGWDVATGLPMRKKLEELGLQDIAVDLAARGLLK